MAFVSSFIITTKIWDCNEQNRYSSLDGGTSIGTINNFETRQKNSKGGEIYIMTSSKPTSNNVIESSDTVASGK